MENIHVVGEEGSFTWLATVERYNRRHKLIGGYSQQKLLERLSRIKKNRISESAIAPIWNSNFGTIALSDTGEDLTAGTLKGEAGRIVDIWGKRIFFSCGVYGKKLFINGDIYSVKVARHQCSDFFDANKKLNFVNGGFDTTTIAYRKFDKNKRFGDGLLCSIELLRKYNINIFKGDVANPFNYTVFFGFNAHPDTKKKVPRISLGCFQMVLEGTNKLPVEFIDYWKDVTRTKEILQSDRVLDAIPKISFILRYEQSKALMLTEMPSRKDLRSPWSNIAGDSTVESLGQIGLLQNSFTSETCNLIKQFKLRGREVLFYGKPDKNTYFWVCPSLKISVHGFEAELVKSCAKIQVMQLKNLQKDGVPFPKEAAAILNKYDRYKGVLKLAADSMPDNI